MCIYTVMPRIPPPASDDLRPSKRTPTLAQQNLITPPLPPGIEPTPTPKNDN